MIELKNSYVTFKIWFFNLIFADQPHSKWICHKLGGYSDKYFGRVLFINFY